MLKLFTVDKPIHPNSLLYSTQPNQIYIDKDSRKENDKNNKNTANTKQKRMNCVDSKYYYNEIKLSKYGLSGYDFSRFNQYLFLRIFWKIRTPFVGLENNIPESFYNNLLFVFWSQKFIHDLLLQHTCNNPVCLSCELYYLFRTLDQAQEAPSAVLYSRIFDEFFSIDAFKQVISIVVWRWNRMWLL